MSGPGYSQAATWQKSPSLRLASPSAGSLCVFGAEVAAARFLAGQRVEGQEFAELHEVGHAVGAFQRRVQVRVGAGHVHVVPELGAQFADSVDGRFESRSVAGHADVLPHDVAEFAVQFDRRLLPLDRQQLLELLAGLGLDALELGVVDRRCYPASAREPVGERVRQDEVAVGEALHQRRAPRRLAPWSEKFASPTTNRPGRLDMSS